MLSFKIKTSNLQKSSRYLCLFTTRVVYTTRMENVSKLQGNHVHDGYVQPIVVYIILSDNTGLNDKLQPAASLWAIGGFV